MNAPRPTQTDGPPCARRERLPALLYRHTVLSLVGRDGNEAHRAAIPATSEALAVYLSRRLPARMVNRLNLPGLLAAGRFMGGAVALAVGIIRPILRAVAGVWDAHRRRADVRAARKHIVQHAPGVLSRRPPMEDLSIGFDGRVRLLHVHFDGATVQSWFRRTGRVDHDCQIFVHLHPQDSRVLPPSRAEHGCFCKDHFFALPIRCWRKSEVFRDDTSVGDLPAGHYRLVVGVIEVHSLERFAVDGSGAMSADLGWITIGAATSQPMKPTPQPGEVQLVHC